MKNIRCAIYTRKSSEEGLEQDFNSLDAQREACAAYVLSQASEGWKLLHEHYDDGGLSGGSLERPALQRLLGDVKESRIDIIVVYKVDRLTRSLLDFAKLVEAFDEAQVSFVSVTQSFNTTTSMGRLTLNMLLSFAQFEREVTAERIRDKIAASKAKGMWMGGTPPLGYEPDGKNGLTIIEDHAALVRDIFRRYLSKGNVRHVAEALEAAGITSPLRTTRKGKTYGGCNFTRGQIYHMLKNPIYAGDIPHKGKVYPGNHPAIIDREEWEAVQTRLASHVKGRRTRREASKALLAGRLFDEDGKPLIPVHTSKLQQVEGARKRYTYYVSKVAHHRSAGNSGPTMRIPAEELEQAVRTELAQIMAYPHTLFEQAQLSIQSHRYEAMTSQAKALHHQILSGAKRIVRSLLKCAAVESEHIALTIDLEQLAQLIEGKLEEGAPTELIHHAAIRFTQTGHTLKLVDDQGCPANTWPDPTLTGLLVRARQWWNELSQGEIDIAGLARRDEVSPSYVTRVVRLAFLAPSVAEAVVAGQIKAGIGGAALLATGAVARDWNEQEAQVLPQR
jgi:DNA invertase Pin-like site-specific DNA recombinase